jgi:hypothetical protein
MKVIAVLGVMSAIAIAAASPADARQGCGSGFHRTPYGRCVPNRGDRVMFVVGRYYPGRGYWYNNRWYHHRQRWHGDWRYR